MNIYKTTINSDVKAKFEASKKKYELEMASKGLFKTLMIGAYVTPKAAFVAADLAARVVADEAKIAAAKAIAKAVRKA